MFASRFIRLARLDRLEPDPAVCHRALGLAFTARFTDELTSGAWVVLGAMVWPVAKSRSLAVAPDLAGSVQAITTLFALLPLALMEAWLAQVLGMGPALALTAAAGAGAMFLVLQGDRR